MSQLYKRIKGLCDNNGVTISKMCKEAHIPNSVIYELKSGKREGISMKTALKLAEYFSVPVEHFCPPIVIDTSIVSGVVTDAMKQKEKPPTMDGRVFELITICNQLTDENLLKAADYIRYLISTQG